MPPDPSQSGLFGHDPHMEEDERACRVCGCTEDDACADPNTLLGTCYWIEWDLCSACDARGASTD